MCICMWDGIRLRARSVRCELESESEKVALSGNNQKIDELWLQKHLIKNKLVDETKHTKIIYSLHFELNAFQNDSDEIFTANWLTPNNYYKF